MNLSDISIMSLFQDGNCHFNYKVSKPGEYLIGVKFNNEHITDSPFKVRNYVFIVSDYLIIFNARYLRNTS